MTSDQLYLKANIPIAVVVRAGWLCLARYALIAFTDKLPYSRRCTLLSFSALKSRCTSTRWALRLLLLDVLHHDRSLGETGSSESLDLELILRT
jgi:hypothetical protein